jgi:hypothetical protein
VETDIQARLQQMVENDPLGKEAAELLHYLIAFQGPFRRQAVPAVAFPNLDEDRSKQAFATLCAYGFVQRTAHKKHKRYYVLDVLRNLIPPAPEASARHLAFYLYGYREVRRTSIFSLGNPRLLRREKKDIQAALLWGLGHQPDSIFQHLQQFRFIWESVFTYQEKLKLIDVI